MYQKHGEMSVKLAIPEQVHLCRGIG